MLGSKKASGTVDQNEVVKIAVLVISNLLKVRNRLGFELSEAWQTDPELEMDMAAHMKELDRVAGPYEAYSDEMLAVLIAQIADNLPGIDWDEENLTDALYMEIHKIHEFVDRCMKGDG